MFSLRSGTDLKSVATQLCFSKKKNSRYFFWQKKKSLYVIGYFIHKFLNVDDA